MRYASTVFFGFTLFLAGCAGGDREHRKPEAPWHPASAMLTKYVTNKDGSLTRAQMDAGLRADFAAADAKHTGCLDEDETRAINEQRYAADQSTYSPLVDFKGKGCIDFDEFAATALSLFDTLDRDNNGVLTAQELNPTASNKPGEGGDDGDHRGHGGHRGGPNGSGGN
jgi:Ca2+-binding EF-hand superfamily protein